MAVSDRVVVLRAGRLAGERRTADTDRARTRRADGRAGRSQPPPVAAVAAGAAAACPRRACPTARRGSAASLDRVSLSLHGGEIIGLAGVSGNGQAALAALIAGIAAPTAGDDHRASATTARDWSPRAALSRRHRPHPGGPPRGRHDRRHERHRERHRRALPHARASAAAASSTGRPRAPSPRQIIADYDVKCPSPDARIRLLSGGNMQKLILGRALDPEPAHHPRQPADARPRRRRRRLCPCASCSRRARAAPAILLISEDLDEILALVRPHRRHVQGPHLSPPSARGER